MNVLGLGEHRVTQFSRLCCEEEPKFTCTNFHVNYVLKHATYFYFISFFKKSKSSPLSKFKFIIQIP